MSRPILHRTSWLEHHRRRIGAFAVQVTRAKLVGIGTSALAQRFLMIVGTIIGSGNKRTVTVKVPTTNSLPAEVDRLHAFSLKAVGFK